LAAGTLRLTFPDGLTAAADLGTAQEAVEARLFGKPRPGRVLRGPAVQALSSWLEEPVRLVLADRTGVGWDEGPVSLVGRASADAVGTPRRGEEPDTARYRMTIEIEGSAAYAEDGWVGRPVQVGGARLRVSHPLERCRVIDGDPRTGTEDWDGLKTLVRVRGRDRLTLGVITHVLAPGRVAVGDQVDPL
ncbi:MAG: MOSC domain-containing protein, partial [Actinomycetes bacterium]